MQEIPIQGTSFLDKDAQSYPGFLHLTNIWISWFLRIHKTEWFRKINFQLSNVALSVNPAMLPNGHLLSPASTENMQKGVIIG